MPLPSSYYTSGRVFETGDRVMLRPVEDLGINEEVEEYKGIPATVVRGNYQREVRFSSRSIDNSWYVDVEFDQEPDVDANITVHQYYPKRFEKIYDNPTWEV
jgi:hypothetical protein